MDEQSFFGLKEFANETRSEFAIASKPDSEVIIFNTKVYRQILC